MDAFFVALQKMAVKKNEDKDHRQAWKKGNKKIVEVEEFSHGTEIE